MDAISVVLSILALLAAIVAVVLYRTSKALKVVDEWVRDSETELQMHARNE